MSAESVLAATLVEPGHYEIREYPLPDPAPGCVLVKMEVSGICPISPHRHLCAKNVRILGVGGEEPAAYGPSMRQMARYMRQYPLGEFVTHRFALRDGRGGDEEVDGGGFHEGCDRSLVVSF
jgi:hypothetical protein